MRMFRIMVLCYHLKSNTIGSNSIDIFKQKAINRDYRHGLIHNQS